MFSSPPDRVAPTSEQRYGYASLSQCYHARMSQAVIDGRAGVGARARGEMAKGCLGWSLSLSFPVVCFAVAASLRAAPVGLGGRERALGGPGNEQDAERAPSYELVGRAVSTRRENSGSC